MIQIQRGFSLIEVIIVIAIIALLATFTTIGYNAVSQQSRDTKRRTDMESLVNGIKAWANDTSRLPIETGAGGSGTGEGFVRGNGSEYANNIDTILTNGGYISREVADPQVTSGQGSYMFYSCNRASATNTTYAFFAKLERPSSKDLATTASWQSRGCTSVPLSAANGMNYAQIFTFSF